MTSPVSTTPSPPPSSELHQNKSAKWKGFLVKVSSAYEAPAGVAGIALIGVFLYYTFPQVASPFFGIAGSMLVSRLAVKVLDHYNYLPLDDIKKRVVNFNRAYPYIRIVLFGSSLLLCAVSQVAAGVLAVGLGVLSGVMIEIEQCKRIQTVNQEKLKKPSSPLRNQLVV